MSNESDIENNSRDHSGFGDYSSPPTVPTVVDLDSLVHRDSELGEDFVVLALPEFDDANPELPAELAVIGLLDQVALAHVFGVDPNTILAHRDAKKHRTVCYCSFCSLLKQALHVW